MDFKENIIMPEDKKLFTKDEFSEYIKLKTEMEILKRFYDKDNYCDIDDFFRITGYERKASEKNEKPEQQETMA